MHGHPSRSGTGRQDRNQPLLGRSEVTGIVSVSPRVRGVPETSLRGSPTHIVTVVSVLTFLGVAHRVYIGVAPV